MLFLNMMNRKKALKALHDEIASCTRCSLHTSRTKAVPGEGPLDAKVMFIGEAPGAQEDMTGRPFVGRSGSLLTEMLNEIGLQREEVFITSVLKSRPPRNRTPHRDEIGKCMYFLDNQIEIVSPKIIVLLGSVAISSVIGPWRLSEAHGRFHEAKGLTYFLTYHPAAALRFPKTRALMHQDFQKLKAELR